MSAPKIIVQVILTGGQIFGKALLQATRQAIKNAKYRPVAEPGSAAGLQNATSGSPTDVLTRQHRMTLDEALLVLNVKKGENSMERIQQHFDHLFKANSPPVMDPPLPKNAGPMHSHYLQSKVVRAKERLEAEFKIAQENLVAEDANVVSPQVQGEPPSADPTPAPSSPSSSSSPSTST